MTMSNSKLKYSKRIIAGSKDFDIILNKEKTGIIGRAYHKYGRAWSIKYIYKGKEYLKFDDVIKVYESDNG